MANADSLKRVSRGTMGSQLVVSLLVLGYVAYKLLMSTTEED